MVEGLRLKSSQGKLKKCCTSCAIVALYFHEEAKKCLDVFLYAMAQLSRKHALAVPAIPDRLYFKIGDVAKLCGIETYVLRFWETQFPQLKPNKSGTGQRLYRRRDVELALEIKRLVHVEGFTLAGARQTLDQGGHRRDPEPVLVATVKAVEPRAATLQTTPDSVVAAVGRVRAELRELSTLLANPIAKPQRRRAKVTTLPASGSLFPC